MYEDEACVAFLDINPATAGHTLVVPKQHADDLLGMSEPQARAVMSATWRVSRILDQRLTPAGINVMQSNRTAAWQDVMHMHVHLVPRYHGDSMRRPWEGAPLQASAFADLQERLRG